MAGSFYSPHYDGSVINTDDFVTPTGTVNAVNVTFTVASQPLYVVSDGITYFEGSGYSYSGGVITMEVPPSQYIRAIL